MVSIYRNPKLPSSYFDEMRIAPTLLQNTPFPISMFQTTKNERNSARVPHMRYVRSRCASNRKSLQTSSAPLPPPPDDADFWVQRYYSYLNMDGLEEVDR